MKRADVKNGEYSLLCTHIRRRLKEELEDYNLNEAKRKKADRNAKERCCFTILLMLVLKGTGRRRIMDRIELEDSQKFVRICLRHLHFKSIHQVVRSSCNDWRSMEGGFSNESDKASGNDGINTKFTIADRHEFWKLSPSGSVGTYATIFHTARNSYNKWRTSCLFTFHLTEQWHHES